VVASKTSLWRNAIGISAVLTAAAAAWWAPARPADVARDTAAPARSDWSLCRNDGWAIARAAFAEFRTDRVLAVAAGVAFYGLLALFPTLTVLVSLYGLFAERSQIGSDIASLSEFLPAGALPIVSEQISRIASHSQTGNILVLAFSLGFAVWSANSGIKALIEALNVAYGVADRRSFVRLNLLSLSMTVGALAAFLLLLAAIAVVPALLAYVSFVPFIETLVWAGRWPLLLLGLLLAFAVLYRYGPDVPGASWRWISPGSFLAAAGLLLFSMLFSWYAANFGRYNETYGTLGAAIALLTWMWLSATIVLLGAELNAELDRRLGKVVS